LEQLTVVLRSKAGEGGRLFGSITNKQIAEELEKMNIKLDKRKIALDEPIRTLGITNVPVKLHPEVTATLKVQVIEGQ
jgi:large subunit ribosomal protein L9